MNRLDTLLSRLLSHSFEVRFEALDNLLKSYGFECRRVSGAVSHVIYKRAGFHPLPIPYKQWVKSRLVKQALVMLQDLVEPDDELVNLWLRRLMTIFPYPTPAN